MVIISKYDIAQTMYPIETEKLKIFYQSRKLLSELYCSSEFELKFKLQPGDIMMFDNHRLLHGRTATMQMKNAAPSRLLSRI